MPHWYHQNRRLQNDDPELLAMEKTVRAERVQEISEEDVKAEGINPIYDKDMYCDERDLTHIHGTGGFIDLWDSINAARGYPWADNPWVWVVEFIAASKIGA